MDNKHSLTISERHAQVMSALGMGLFNSIYNQLNGQVRPDVRRVLTEGSWGKVDATLEVFIECELRDK
jgi:hypothetical protein